ncbi:hypothetical protein ACHAXA_006993 [Cyclostephanos tholiformis]|uniref:Uncharacterized protein n=1 Tax=Cyclostephanos tholiformis TaxID=382380 RepID=A0ABD3R1H0_9STRA
MPRQKKRGRGRPPKVETASPPIKRKRKSCESAIEAGTTNKGQKATNNDEENASSPPTKKRRGRKPEKLHGKTGCETDPSTGPNGGNGNDHVKEESEVEAKKGEEMSCSNCNKTFRSQLGLKYHLDKQVCQAATTEESCKGKMANTKDAPPSHSKRFERRCKTLISKKSGIYAGDGGERLEGFDSEEVLQRMGKKRKEKPTAGKSAQKSSKLKRGEQVKKANLNSDNDYSDGRSDQDSVQGHNATKRRKSFATSFQLKKGARFITKFGIVEVIADDRLPKNHSKSIINQKAVRSFLKRRDRFQERKLLLLDKIAAGTRHRREELKKMYLESKTTRNGGSSLSQQKVWDLYCKSLTAKQIVADGLSYFCGNAPSEKANKIETGLEDDPRSPKDHYLDRIVECKLVQDERELVVVTSGLSLDDGQESNNLTFRREITSNPKNPVQMRLFLSRRELTRDYDSSKVNYKCDNCGKDYTYRTGISLHMTACKAEKEKDKEKRRYRIEAIESKVFSELGCRDSLTILHGVVNEVRNTGTPAFGNPHRIKEHKMHRWPPYLVFNAKRSSMYPEIYVSMEFKRGSQNRNHFNRIKQECGYIPNAEKRRAAKKLRKKLRMMDPGEPALLAEVCTARKPAPNQGAKIVANQQKTFAKTKNEPPDLCLPSSDIPPLPSTGDLHRIGVDFDGPPESLNGASEVSSVMKPTPKLGATHRTNVQKKKKTEKERSGFDSPSSEMPPLTSSGDHHGTGFEFDNNFDGPSECLNGDIDAINRSSDVSYSRNICRRKGISISKKKTCIVIDTQVLAAECESGRYPTINRFHGDHDTHCILCKKPDDSTLLNCDFCKNSFHQLCLDKSMLQKDPQVVIRENEPDDTPMCNKCISTCLFRRWRAENRRLTKWQHELAKAGLGSVPEAANLRVEVNLNKANGTNDYQDVEGVGEEDKLTYESCPDGGPGGLICCSYCTAAYSRFLSNTAKEMEAQTVARVGQEISEILELLEDAKQRLQRASHVSQSNEERRSILDQNQTAHGGVSFP